MRKYNYYNKLNIDFGPLNGISNYYDKNENKFITLNKRSCLKIILKSF